MCKKLGGFFRTVGLKIPLREHLHHFDILRGHGKNHLEVGDALRPLFILYQERTDPSVCIQIVRFDRQQFLIGFQFLLCIAGLSVHSTQLFPDSGIGGVECRGFRKHCGRRGQFVFVFGVDKPKLQKVSRIVGEALRVGTVDLDCRCLILVFSQVGAFEGGIGIGNTRKLHVGIIGFRGILLLAELFIGLSQRLEHLGQNSGRRILRPYEGEILSGFRIVFQVVVRFTECPEVCDTVQFFVGHHIHVLNGFLVVFLLMRIQPDLSRNFVIGGDFGYEFLVSFHSFVPLFHFLE